MNTTLYQNNIAVNKHDGIQDTPIYPDAGKFYDYFKLITEHIYSLML